MSVNPRGGNYGGTGFNRESRTKGHVCGNCRWQGQGRDDCPNNVRASQVTPYEREDDEDCPAGDCDKSDHAECWSEYDRQENEYKYRPVKGLF